MLGHHFYKAVSLSRRRGVPKNWTELIVPEIMLHKGGMGIVKVRCQYINTMQAK